MQTDGTMDQHDAAGGDYSPWVADLVSGLCLWFSLFVLFVVVALAFLFVCLLLFKVLSLGGRPGQRYVLVVFLVCLVCCYCSCLFVVVEITLLKNCRFGIALNP